MKKYFTGFVLMLMTTLSDAQQIPVNQPIEMYNLTLEECINYALHNNYNRQSLNLDKSVKEINYSQSKQERLPIVSASASQSVTNTPDTDKSTIWNGNYGVNANMTIYNGGTIKNTIEQNKLKVQQVDYQTKQYDNELAINVIQAFLSVLGNEELLNLQQTLLKTSEEQMHQGEEQLMAGTILESDYLLLESQYASDKYNVVNTEINRNNNLLTLKNLLSLSPAQRLNIIPPDTAIIHNLSALPALDDVMQVSLQTIPDLQISKYNVSIAQSGIKLSQAGYLPTLSLGAGIGTGYNSGNDNSWGTQLSKNFNEQASLTLSIPIFSKSRNKANVQQSKILLQQAELKQSQTELNVMQQVEQEYQNILSAYGKYIASETKQNAYKASFDAYREQFKVGSITTVDLLLQQNNYISALNDYIQSKYIFILDRKILDVYMDVPVKL
ncbi:MAG: TolC family protein [Prevotellaceae bacterium]|jgi:outer membrane protein|nr:TolC family protein [Prevotellaceae bacterium]